VPPALEGRKAFFFEKKKQKTFFPTHLWFVAYPVEQTHAP
jgi:hypothetical protein